MTSSASSGITPTDAPNPTPAIAPAVALYRPLVQLLVAALGALITHQLAYLAANSLAGFDPSSGPDHGHLPLQWTLVTPLAVGGAGCFIVWQLRQLGFQSLISPRKLSALVVAFFAIQELAEGLFDGRSALSTITSPAVLLGFGIAPAVAWLLTRLLRSVTELVAALLSGGRIHPPAAGPLVPLPVHWTSASSVSTARPRAPPRLFQY